jgi:hypothetical protein
MTEPKLFPIDSLFRQSATPESTDQKTASPDNGSQNWKQYGFQQARNHSASPIALEVELRKLMEQYKKTMQTDEQEQEEMKAPLRACINTLSLDARKLTEQSERIRTEKIPILENRRNELKKEISEIRRNPEIYQEKPSRLGLVLMALVLILLSVYLWIFYTSASYSAFFRQFKADDINVANSIFDPRAISNAWEKGAPALVLVITMPFIFLGLGILMHKFLEEKHWSKWIKLGTVILATLAFDYIIAYEIVKKIYDLQALNSLENLPSYSFQMAFSDINFWLIIFAGFVTYLIWGFLFEKFMTENRKMDHAGEHIRVREREIEENDKEMNRLLKEAEALDKAAHEKERDKLVAENNLGSVFFRTQEVEYVIYHFMSGWMQFIEGGLMAEPAHKNELRTNTKKLVMDFLDTQKPKYSNEAS